MVKYNLYIKICVIIKYKAVICKGGYILGEEDIKTEEKIEEKEAEITDNEKKTVADFDRSRIRERRDEELALLRGAKENLEKTKEYEESIKKLTVDVKKARKNLENAKKEVQLKIEKAWKAGMEEACGDLTVQMNGRQKELTKLKNERAADKEKKIAERIERETEHLYTENKEKKSGISDLYSEDGVPALCKTRFYFALFAPKGAADLLILVISQLVAFGVIPMSIYFMIKDRGAVHLIIIYIFTVIIFGGLYALIMYFTRIKYKEKIIAARDISLEIRSNKRKIKEIENNIINDDDESLYGLEEIDGKISKLQEEFDDICSRLEEAKTEFENITKDRIKNRIEEENKNQIDELTGECALKENELRTADDELYKLDEEYESLYMDKIPKEYMKEQKLEKIIELFEDGDAMSIESAILILKSTGK